MMSHNLHIVGALARDRRPFLAKEAKANILVDCHRGLRGPYTGLDAILGSIMPGAYKQWPELVNFHRLELLDGLPELSELIGPAPHTLAGDAPFVERTRWFGPLMIRVINQGIVTFMREYALRTLATGDQLPTLIFDGAQNADITTQEFIALFVRRVGAEIWPVVVGSTGDLRPVLADALEKHARRIDAVRCVDSEEISGADLAVRYVDSDGTSDDPRAYEEYLALAPADRVALHDRRAQDLELNGAWGVRIAALPYHRERGSDPSGAGVAALLEAAQHCTSAGFSSMVLELAARGRSLTDPDRDPRNYRKLCQLLIAQLITHKRLGEAMDLCNELRRRYADPMVHMNTSYFIAMIHTRFAIPRDHEKAAEWQNNAIVSASALPEERERLILSGFQENGMALIEMHRGNLDRALSLVATAINRLDERLEPGEWAVHRSQLIYNHTRLLSALGRHQEAYVAYTRLIEMDPHYTDYLSERAKIARRQGDLESALRDYSRAVETGPPFAELFHNRGSAYVELGLTAEALDDFDFVLDMEPDDTETLLSRAELLFNEGNVKGALADLGKGLDLVPEDPRMLCLRGMAQLESGQTAAARRDFDRALSTDPGHLAALVNRAVAFFTMGEARRAVDDLTEALRVSGADPDLLLNRAIAHSACADTTLALADIDHALPLPDADIAALRFQRGACLLKSGQVRLAEDDLRTALDHGYDRNEVTELLELCQTSALSSGTS
jgi:tetratricopeptide (TPR) repeat protein